MNLPSDFEWAVQRRNTWDVFPPRLASSRLRYDKFSSTNATLDDLYELLVESDDAGGVEELLDREFPDTYQGIKDFSQKVEEWWENGHTAFYTIRRLNEHDPILGFAIIDNIQWDRKRCEVGVWLRKSAWGEQYGVERALTLLHVCFEKLDMEYVVITTAMDNDRAISSIETYIDWCNGQNIGRIPNEYIHNTTGEPLDCWMYAISREEFRNSTAYREPSESLIHY